MDVSFKELSAWISVVVLGGFCAWYFVKAGPEGGHGPAGAVLLAAVIGIIFWEILLHIAAAIFHRPEHADERDRTIAALGQRNAYFALMTGIVAAIGVVAGAPVLGNRLAAVAGLDTLNLLVLTVFAAEILNYGSQIFYYRRGG